MTAILGAAAPALAEAEAEAGAAITKVYDGKGVVYV